MAPIKKTLLSQKVPRSIVFLLSDRENLDFNDANVIANNTMIFNFYSP